MRLHKLAIVLAIASTLGVSLASAQQLPLEQSGSGVAIASDYGRETVLVADEEPAMQEDSGGAVYYSEPVADGEDEPFKLFEPEFLKKRDITVGGWTAQSVTFNFDSPNDRFNGPVTWMDRSNQYFLNQQYFFIERLTDNGGEGIDIGFRSDMLYGSDARFTTAAGLEDRINKSQSFYGLALPQQYLEVAYNDLKVKIGHFYSPVGYFVVPTVGNFFNTLPYTFQYGEPFTHTGALATYQMTDDLAIGSGFTRGWDNFGAFNPHLGYLGTLTRTNVLKEGDSFAYVGTWSYEPNQQPGRFNGPGFSPRYLQTLVYSRPITERMTYVLQSDFGTQQNAMADGRTARWYGINTYTFLKSKRFESVTWGLGSEWFRDEEGFRVGGFLPNFTNNTIGGPSKTRGLPTTRSGYAGSFYQTTFGPNWQPNSNLIIRPNLRFDYYQGADNNAGGLRPFDDGNKNHQWILATDVVLTY